MNESIGGNTNDFTNVILNNLKILSDEEEKKINEKKFNMQKKQLEQMIIANGFDVGEWEKASFGLFPKSIKYNNSRDYFLYGNNGSGKTLFAHAVGKHLISKGKKAVLVTDSEMRNELILAAKGDKVLNFFGEYNTLILADIQPKLYTTETMKLLLDEMLETRWRKGKRVILISNVSFEPLLTKRMQDRYNETMDFIKFTGDSRRQNKSQVFSI